MLESKDGMITLTGFLRGINVGGHHKVPMADLRDKLNQLECENVRTLLNTGNFVFETEQTNIQDLEHKIETFLSQSFGFIIPVILRGQKEISDLVSENPFATIDVHKDIRLYVSFLKNTPEVELTLPYFSEDKTYKIISIQNKTILSVLDLSTTNSPKGMDELEKLFGKNMTTRNWNTVQKVANV
ncbi:DUF1697 domain-containing protein [Sphingobacterium alkalisoli]|uniref:DUF1697 domain-containing protein n=1 Tax=Sphingobacterium alkalisoli TaxID=1874115 RepID=A0A4U0GXQ8_9SPHI|nr:DUF1697 domain-containing protein [Sphingobacterium alkalisoli]TJY63454.1 DUF1697 domain-containing protein [Sphingobacterium alkalisoli]GGH26172.1 hypothetical protein GCM10011418_35240 [Sphingobacterium alkalisoli]